MENTNIVHDMRRGTTRWNDPLGGMPRATNAAWRPATAEELAAATAPEALPTPEKET